MLLVLSAQYCNKIYKEVRKKTGAAVEITYYTADIF